MAEKVAPEMEKYVNYKDNNMTIAKAAVTGVVYKEPKTGYTQNNVAVSSFVLNIAEGGDETLVRVISKKTNLSGIVDSLSRNQKVLVGGKLQTATNKLDDGSEKKVYEIDASSIEIIGGSTESSSYGSVSEDGSILSFGEVSNPDTDVLMSDEEVPF